MCLIHENNSLAALDYLVKEWYNLKILLRWVRRNASKKPLARTTMLVEGHWSMLKRCLFQSYNRPRVDMLLYCTSSKRHFYLKWRWSSSFCWKEGRNRTGGSISWLSGSDTCKLLLDIRTTRIGIIGHVHVRRTDAAHFLCANTSSRRRSAQCTDPLPGFVNLLS